MDEMVMMESLEFKGHGRDCDNKGEMNSIGSQGLPGPPASNGCGLT